MPNSNIRIIVESHVPFVAGLLDPYATVRYLSGEEIDAKAAATADGMIIRTRTRCDAALLDKSPCKIIATATIGTDHIDMDYCRRRGITVVNVPGCNAPAVAQYVFGSIMAVINRPLRSYTLGIVGVGHVGSLVEKWARSLDMKVMACDPPRQRAEGGEGWSTLDEIAEKADIITFHTPLTREGDDATYHMIDAAFLARLKRFPIIINSARGEIADTAALVAASKAGKTGPLVIDCWEHEPTPDPELLALAAVATPHIAGYSREGKVRASQQAVDALTTFFMLPRVTIDEPLPPAAAGSVTIAGITSSYDPAADTAALKGSPADFEKLRNGYNYRHETPEGRED